MVVFICDGCQESLSRGKVKAHANRCRNCWVLSCVDCGARFEGDAYEKHITCMSESQKYAGKKETKQDEWANCVVKAIETIKDASAKRAFEGIVSRIGEATVPKKKQKFVNLCKSSQSHLTESTVNAIWDAIESARKEAIAEKEKIKQEELAKKKAAQEAKGTKATTAEPDSTNSTNHARGKVDGEDQEDLDTLRKKLKKALKKADKDQGMDIRDAAEVLGRKRTVKKVVAEFPEHFVLEKTEAGKRVRLCAASE